MLWGIYSAIYELLVHRCEKCVEIKGDYVEKQQSCFISVTLKSWSGRKLLDHTTYTLKEQIRYENSVFPFFLHFLWYHKYVFHLTSNTSSSFFKFFSHAAFVKCNPHLRIGAIVPLLPLINECLTKSFFNIPRILHKCIKNLYFKTRTTIIYIFAQDIFNPCLLVCWLINNYVP